MRRGSEVPAPMAEGGRQTGEGEPAVAGSSGASALQTTAEHEHTYAHADGSREASHEREGGTLNARPTTLNAPHDSDAAPELLCPLDPFAPLDSDDIEWLQEQEAKRLARQRRTCRYCGTVFHLVSPSVEECPSLGRHEAHCARASAEERAFYAAHRRWPRALRAQRADGREQTGDGSQSCPLPSADCSEEAA